MSANVNVDPWIVALALVFVAWLVHRATRKCPKCYNPEDFK